MIRHKLCVLGGSSPYTAAFVDALGEAAHQLPPFELSLYGKNQESLELVAAYSRNRLSPHEWSVSHSTEMREAACGSDIVLHQIRYGGLERRKQHEELSASRGLPPDETLGPTALLSAIQMRDDLEETCEVLGDVARDAWVLDLTNPVSFVTGRMTDLGLKRVLGICELPMITVKSLAGMFHISTDALEWSYAGLNHRGFIYGVTYHGKDMVCALQASLGPNTFEGSTVQQLAELGAIPLKYFSLVSGRPQVIATGRAQFLMDLVDELISQLKRSTLERPAGLSKRDLRWYTDAAVPLIVALCSVSPTTLVVNCRDEDGLVRESRVEISRSGIGKHARSVPPSGVQRWVGRFEDHERLLQHAALNPNREAVHAALAADPMLAGYDVELLRNDLLSLV
jgi:6-phospho-beta-glucosidase